MTLAEHRYSMEDRTPPPPAMRWVTTSRATDGVRPTSPSAAAPRRLWSLFNVDLTYHLNIDFVTGGSFSRYFGEVLGLGSAGIRNVNAAASPDNSYGGRQRAAVRLMASGDATTVVAAWAATHFSDLILVAAIRYPSQALAAAAKRTSPLALTSAVSA